MAQTQQIDPLTNVIDGSQLDAQPTWIVTPAADKFVFPNATFSTSNGIAGVFHKPATTAIPTGVNLPRGFLAQLVPKLSETKVIVSVKHRVSASTNGKWPPANGNVDIEAGVIVRASGTVWGTDKWYEAGITNLDSNNIGSLTIRRIDPSGGGVSTVLASTSWGTINPALLYPSFNNPANTYNNLWATLSLTAETVGATVKLRARIDVPGDGVNPAQSVEVTFDDFGPNRITTPGYGGIFSTGNAATTGSLWGHFSDFVLSANGTDTGPSAFADPYVAPALVARVDAPTVPFNAEPASVGTLPVEPFWAVQVRKTYEKHDSALEQGSHATHPIYPDPRRVWELHWDRITNAQWDALDSFFSTTIGPVLSFTWTPPRETTPIVVSYIPATWGKVWVDGKFDGTRKDVLASKATVIEKI